jgi:hypothetical protein
MKMMATYVDALGKRTKFWKPCKSQCTKVICKDLAIIAGLGTDDLKTFLANFLNQKQNRKYVP